MATQDVKFDKFNYSVGKIFAVLLEKFPRRIQLDMVALLGAEQCDQTYSSDGRWSGIYKVDGEYENLQEEIEFLYETAHWLAETRYLMGHVGHGQTGRSAFVTLSPLTLEILKVMPSSVSEPGATLGQEIVSAAKSAGKAKIAELASSALSYAVRTGWDVLVKSQSG